MSLPISPIINAPALDAIRPAAQAAKPGEFMNVLQGAIASAENVNGQATQQIQNFIAGESEDVHSVALSVQRAELTFELGMQIRNKVVQAYQEVMRMQM